jgi:membrane protein YdbS with pleckstrin-like domain
MNENTQRVAEKFYQGFWGILTTWFKVPEHPPSMATHHPEETVAFKPSEGYLRYMKFTFWIGLVLIDGVIGLAWIFLFVFHPLAGILTLPLALILAFLPDIFAYLAIYLKFDTTWYVMTQRSIRIRRGIWVISEMTLTFENIQNVTVTQGPLQRHFNIANIVIETAGGGSGDQQGKGGGMQLHQGLIEGIHNAPEIRDQILDRLRRSKSSGLGDDKNEPAHQVPMWTSEHVNVLKEIKRLVP